MTEPKKLQKEVLNSSIDKRLWAFFAEAGTGKTFMAITTAERWFKEKGCLTVVVVAAKTLIFGTWIKEELPKHSTAPYNVYGWSGKLTSDDKRRITQMVNDKTKLLYLIVNPDGLKSKGFQAVHNFAIKVRGRTGWIYDESTGIKNQKTDRWEYASRMSTGAMFKRIMTGTPVTEGPLDVFAQTEFLEEGLLGFKSYYSMKTRYCEIRRRKFGNRSFDEIIGYRDLDNLYQRLSKFSSFIKLTDMVDMPEQIQSRVAIELTPEQETHYKTMRKLAIAWIEEHEITAVNALAMLRKLHQIAVGQMRIDEDKYVSIPNNRLEALSDLMEEANHPFIIWSVYRNSSYDILKHLGPKKVIAPSVKDSPEERANKIASWKAGNQQGILLSQASAAHGLTLIEGLTAVFYSNDFSAERRIQALRRNWRLGQTQKTRVVDFYAPNTVEVGILDSLDRKIEIADIAITKKGLIDAIDGILRI